MKLKMGFLFQVFVAVSTILSCRMECSEAQRIPVYVSVVDVYSLSYKPYRANSSVPACLLAIDDINNSTTILPNHELVPIVNIASSYSDFLEETKLFSEIWYSGNVSAFIGPPASTSSVYPGLLASRSNIPYLAWVASDSRFVDTTVYKTFIRTVGNLEFLGPSIVELMNHFSWTRIAYVEFHDETHLSIIISQMTYIVEPLRHAGLTVLQGFHENDPRNISTTLLKASKEARSEFFCC